MTEPALFEMDEREGADVVHVLLPNMSYACGGNILTKRGTSRCGTTDWDRITCPDCLAFGHEVLTEAVCRMQGREPRRDEVSA